MFVTFGYMLALAYVAAFITYQIAVALGAGLITPAASPISFTSVPHATCCPCT